ncbi:MAG: hypothetical protein REI12_10895 [Pedobacter sp.]|nr:hypothetical protein [Pedobacter sp.]
MKRAALAVALAGLCAQAAAENITPNLKFNGFGTASAAAVNKDQGGEYLRDTYTNYLGLTEDPNYTLESVLGLQFDYRINDKTSIVTQLVAKGSDYFDVNAEWAYIAYQFNDNLRGRAGHLGMPIFMYSDSIYVGQSYPWVRLPSELYHAIPTTSFSGADLLYRLPVGESWNFNAQVLTGASNTPQFYTSNAVGTNLSLSNDSLLMRVGYTQSKLDNPAADNTALQVDGEKTSFLNAGFILDDGKWFVAGEFGQLKIDGWLSDWNAGYLSAGHYFGKWLPYVLASTTHTFNEQDCLDTGACVLNIPGVANIDRLASSYLNQTTYAIGAKYAVSSGLSIKSQVDKVIPSSGSNGFVAYQDIPNPAPGAITPSPYDESTMAHNPTSFYVFTLALTAAF